jgi:hypothetical protein
MYKPSKIKISASQITPASHHKILIEAKGQFRGLNAKNIQTIRGPFRKTIPAIKKESALQEIRETLLTPSPKSEDALADPTNFPKVLKEHNALTLPSW